MRYSIILSYCGAAFHGWQIQADAVSVQEVLEKALSVLLKEKISVTGAGRTDTGVNAIGYTAHFDCSTEADTRTLTCKLNAILPRELAVLSVKRVRDDFHARFDATKREYTYYLHRVKDPFVESFSYFCAYPGLDFDKMNRVAAKLVGRRDFRCFEKSGADNKTSICTVFEAVWVPYEPTVHAARRLDQDGKPLADYWYFRISADRFLRNMVRAIVGTLIEVGRGKRSEESFEELLLAAVPEREKSVMRSCAGESVPGHALFLSDIEYDSDKYQK